MEKLNAQLAQAEEKLGDSELYDQSRKAELTACLQQQASAKSGLEECEMAWLEAQVARADVAGRPKQLMAQITTTDANEFSSSAEFTLCAALAIVICKPCCRVCFVAREIHPVLAAAELPDGDFVDLAWSEAPAQLGINRV